MPSGKEHHAKHKRYTVAFHIVNIATLLISIIITKSPWWIIIPIWIGSVFGWEQGKYIDPDLDQLDLTIAEGKSIRKFGLAGWLYTGYWTMYAILMNIVAYITGTQNGRFGAHRTFWTHSYIFSTAIRFIFINIPVYITLYYMKANLFNQIMAIAMLFHIGNFNGLAYSDALHIYFDRREV